MTDILDTIQATIGLANFRTLEGLYNAGAHKQVIAGSEAFVAQAPDLYPVLALRGLSFTALRRWDQAIACFEKVLALRPGERNALPKYATCLWKVGRVDEAISRFAENFRLYPNPESGTYLVRAAACGCISLNAA